MDQTQGNKYARELYNEAKLIASEHILCHLKQKQATAFGFGPKSTLKKNENKKSVKTK
jgi:hypothetical protein